MKEGVKTQAGTLEGFVKDNLTASQYERLHELLGITKNAVTSMFRNPSTSATIDNVKDLARLTGTQPRELVMRYGMGMATIYLSEAKELGLVIS